MRLGSSASSPTVWMRSMNKRANARKAYLEVALILARGMPNGGAAWSLYRRPWDSSPIGDGGSRERDQSVLSIAGQVQSASFFVGRFFSGYDRYWAWDRIADLRNASLSTADARSGMVGTICPASCYPFRGCKSISCRTS